MCTANDIENIPGPLLDRMEVIRLSGYDVPEKVAIAEQYLVPKAMRENGLMLPRKTPEPPENAAASGDSQATNVQKQNEIKILRDGVPASLSIDRSALESLVRWYCREAGVRNLNKYIEKITRKLALQIVAEDEKAPLTQKSSRKSDTWVISDANLNEYVGKQIFTNDRMYEKDPLPHGIVMGLAWTSMGGK
jgi:Lon-like ATP-dependent protease